MNSLLLAILLFSCSALGGFLVLGSLCPLATRDSLLGCINQIDGDSDGSITVSELDAFYAAHASCLPTGLTTYLDGNETVTLCDTNADTNLTMADWTSPNGCLQLRNRQMMICQMCEKCGLLIVKK